jgi:hypothetical protein
MEMRPDAEARAFRNFSGRSELNPAARLRLSDLLENVLWVLFRIAEHPPKFM